MALNDFSDVQEFFNDFISANNITVGTSPHKAFWQQALGDVEASRDKFVNGNVPGLNPNKPPVKILVKGDSAASNIINILRAGGIPGYVQMPKDGPFFSEAQIQELADWIDGLDADDDNDV